MLLFCVYLSELRCCLFLFCGQQRQQQQSWTIYDGSLFKHKFWMDRFANFNTTFITIIFDQFFPVDSARILHDSFGSSLQQWLWVNCLIQCFDRAAMVWTENDAEIARVREKRFHHLWKSICIGFMVSNYMFRDFPNLKTAQEEKIVTFFFIDFNRSFPKTYRLNVLRNFAFSRSSTRATHRKAFFSLHPMWRLQVRSCCCGIKWL